MRADSMLFIAATGTNAGKTFVSRGLTRALVRRGRRVAAIKPIETGCAPSPLDALALARAARIPSLAHAAAFYRAEPPLAPQAIHLAKGQPGPNVEQIVEHARVLEREYEHVVVESAGGILVPIDDRQTIADLARALTYRVLLVAPDQLGVLSHVLTAAESASARALRIPAIVLSPIGAISNDPSPQTNASILERRLRRPVLRFPESADDDDALADAAISCGLLDALGWA